MAYTSHGHHIPGTPTDDAYRLVARCGGFKLCFVCAQDVLAYENNTILETPVYQEPTESDDTTCSYEPLPEQEPQPLADKIKDAIVHSDCYCKPGDPTCSDWKSSEDRWAAQHEAVMRVVNRHFEKRQSNLVDHARRELELLGEEDWVVEGYLNVIQAFADCDHSGGSASIAIPVISELLQFHNLTDLTNDPEEWMQISEEVWGSQEACWQSRRRSDAFSYNNGVTYYLLSDPKVFHISAEKRS